MVELMLAPRAALYNYRGVAGEVIVLSLSRAGRMCGCWDSVVYLRAVCFPRIKVELEAVRKIIAPAFFSVFLSAQAHAIDSK